MGRNNNSGFTLIELMIVVAIVAFLCMISVPNFMRFLAKAKRAEAHTYLAALCLAEKAHCAEHGSYSAILSGQGGVGWKPEGYTGGGSNERFYYTYGFNEGSEGQNYFTGKLAASSAELQGTYANQNGFVAGAAADLIGNGVDRLTINHLHDIQVVQDGIS